MAVPVGKLAYRLYSGTPLNACPVSPMQESRRQKLLSQGNFTTCRPVNRPNLFVALTRTSPTHAHPILGSPTKKRPTFLPSPGRRQKSGHSSRKWGYPKDSRDHFDTPVLPDVVALIEDQVFDIYHTSLSAAELIRQVRAWIYLQETHPPPAFVDRGTMLVRSSAGC